MLNNLRANMYPMWYPINKKDRDHMEKVQRRAIKIVPGIRDLPYEETYLKIPSLVYRKRRGDMIQVYKITHGLEDIP